MARNRAGYAHEQVRSAVRQTGTESRISPLAMAETALAADRVHADPAIWIFRHSDATILKQAQALQAEGPRDRPLWGVPFAVKDNIDVAGIQPPPAVPDFAYTPGSDAPAVRRCSMPGALLIGKTNLDQFATGLVGTRSPYGVPRNVFDPKLVPGGSSSGSACAVAAGIVPFALGTDTAGSGRVPAGFGNIVGLKPTVGSVSARGMVPACRSIDTISVFARSVDEALLVQRLIAAFDAQDPYARQAPLHICGARRLCRWRVWRWRMSPHCARRTLRRPITSACAVPERSGDGYRVVPGDRSTALRRPVGGRAHRGLAIGDRAAAGHPVSGDARDPGSRPGPPHHRCLRCLPSPAAGSPPGRRLLPQYDALLLPAAPFCPGLAEIEADPLGPNRRLGTFTNFANLCDMAGFAVPIGFATDGMPVGGVLLGPAWSEGRLAPLADALHRRFATTVGATGKPLPPPLAPDALATDRNRVVLHRRAYVRAAAERPNHRA